MELRTTYKDKEWERRKKGFENLKEYFFEDWEMTFSKDDDPEKVKEKYEKFFSKKSNDISRVWLLFARHENGPNDLWESLQVAHSKYNVQREIEEDLKFIFCEFNPDKEDISFTNSAFYEKVCPNSTVKKDKRELLYSKIGSEYKYFRICFLNVDKYLGTKQNSSNNTDADRIIEICKNQYAEAKIALETLAVYWNLYSSGIDGQTIAYIRDERDREIARMEKEHLDQKQIKKKRKAD